MMPENVFISKNSLKLREWEGDNKPRHIEARKIDAYNRFGRFVRLDPEPKLDENVDIEIRPIDIISTATGHSQSWARRLTRGQIRPDDATHHALNSLLKQYFGVDLEVGDWHIPPDSGVVFDRFKTDGFENHDYQLRTDENKQLFPGVDSSIWTGLSKKISAQHLTEIQTKVAALNGAILQSDADDQTKLNAIKRVAAVQSLLEAPNVPWREVVEILNAPSMTAFLTVLNLIQFIFSLAK